MMIRRCILPWDFGIWASLLLLSCSTSSPQPGDSSTSIPDFADIIQDPDVYVAAPDPAAVITQSTVHGEVSLVANHLLLLARQDTDRGQIEALAARIGGQIVGQIPRTGFYQILLPTVTLEALNTAIAQAQADANIRAAGYNTLLNYYQVCPAPSDNEDLVGEQRCAFADTEYYQALTIFDEFRSLLTLHPVNVAVIDSGVAADNGEFDDIWVVNASDWNAPVTDSRGHGTAVAGIIAADDDSAGVNGLASRFLYDDLRLFVGASSSDAEAVVDIWRVADNGARVINLSFGVTAVALGNSAAQQIWETVIDFCPNSLFVISAGNDNVEVGRLQVPANINGLNVITVGGTAHCDPAMKAANSNYGEFVDVAAPYEYVPVVGVSNGHATEYAYGTSVSAPQVSALAAILFSLNPSLTPEQVRNNYILGASLPADVSVGGRRIAFSRAIGQLLIDMRLGTPIAETLDPTGEGQFGSSAHSLSHICPTFGYNVDGYGSHEVVRHGPNHQNTSGAVFQDSFMIGGGEDGSAFVFNVASPFRLQTYIVSSESEPGSAYVRFSEDTAAVVSMGISGFIVCESCEIIERNPVTQAPWMVNITGYGEGSLLAVAWNPLPPTTSTLAFTTHFTTICSAPMLVEGDSMWTYLENNCAGGRPTP